MTMQKKKIRLLIKDGNKCIYCENKFKDVEDATIDHILPKIKGGTNNINNLGLACSECNREKGNLLLTEYIRAKELKVTRILARYL